MAAGDSEDILQELADFIKPPAIDPATKNEILIAKNQKLTAKRIGKFGVDFDPDVISCTPSGNIVACRINGGSIKTLDLHGRRLKKFTMPYGTKIGDVDCTKSHYYIADKATDSVFMVDYDGTIVTSLETGMKDIAAVSVNDNKIYITNILKNEIYEADILQGPRFSALRNFAPSVELASPEFICARGDLVAISNVKFHCVDVLNPDGSLRYRHGTYGKAGVGSDLLNQPGGLALDSANRLFIADQENNIVCVLNDKGSYIGQIDVESPLSVAITPDDLLIVGCPITSDIRIYNL